jgi:hypothetical protein
MRLRIAVGFALLLAACATPSLPPVPQYDAAALAATRFKAVLVAGDPSIVAFDNATARFERALRARAGVSREDIYRLSARDEVLRDKTVLLATVQATLATIEDLKPGPGEGCLVFATMHGARGQGLYMPRGFGDHFLDPASLDRALALGCGNAPTVVIMSGCFSGIYAQPPVTRDNRIVLTAAAADRASFGCGAGNDYTYFDACLLGSLDQLGVGMTWQDAISATRQCVAAREAAMGAVPSHAQSWVGPAVTGMPLPWRRGGG